jgi:hypothetical protein
LASSLVLKTTGSLFGAICFCSTSRLVVATWAPILSPLRSAMLFAPSALEPAVVITAWATV